MIPLAPVSDQHLFERTSAARRAFRSGDRRDRMISVTHRTLGGDSPLRTVTRDAIRFHWHQDVGSFATLGGVMAIVAFYARVLRVIEFCQRHPAIHQHRSCDYRRAVRNRLHFMTEGATGK